MWVCMRFRTRLDQELEYDLRRKLVLFNWGFTYGNRLRIWWTRVKCAQRRLVCSSCTG